MFVCIALSICSVMARIYFLKQNMPQFETLVYLKTLFRIVLSIAIVVIVTYLLTYTGLKGFYFLIASTLLSIGLLLFTFIQLHFLQMTDYTWVMQ